MELKNIVFVDLETTGVNPAVDAICEIGIIHYDGSGKRTEANYLINPLREMKQEVIDIHGITNEMVSDKPSFAEIAENLYQEYFSPEVTKVFVAYNFQFDYGFLKESFKRCEIDLKNDDYTFVDPMAIFKNQIPHTLESAVQFYCNKKHENAHRALDDIKATEQVFFNQCSRHAELFAPGLKEVQKQLLGSCKMMSTWFKENEEAQYVFTKGKHQGEIVTKAHSSYLSWISGLSDTTADEIEFIQGIIYA